MQLREEEELLILGVILDRSGRKMNARKTS